MDIFTAIVPAAGAGSASTARQIRFDGASISRLNPFFIGWGFDDDSRQFVADNSGIRIEGVAPGEGVKITSANTHLFYPDQRFSGIYPRNFSLALSELSRCFEYDLPHCPLPASCRIGSSIYGVELYGAFAPNVNMISGNEVSVGSQSTMPVARRALIWKPKLDAEHLGL